MTQKPTYIQLEVNEDIASIRDRLSFIRGQRVLLIWPEEGTALTKKLDLVLVQREAKRRVIQLALVTHDPVVIEHALELEISTFETINNAERGRWKRGRNRVFTQRHHKPEDEPEPEELMLVASRVRKPKQRYFETLTPVFRVIILIAVLCSAGLAIYVTVPSAEIIFTLEEQPISVETVIMADENALDVDVENAIIPATRLRATVQTDQQIETTGRSAGENRRAIGIVTFTNQTPRALDIPEGTVLTTSSNPPVRFVTTVPESLIGQIGATVEVSVQADIDSSGEIGNIQAGQINTVIGPLSIDVTVRNLTPTTGGESISYAIVTEEDQTRLLGIVRGQLQARAYTEMESSLTDSQVIVIDTVQIPENERRSDWITFSNQPGDRADTLSLSMRAVVEALVIDDRFARQIVFARLSANKPDNLILNLDSFDYRRGAVINTTENNQIIFNAFGESLATASFDPYQLQNRLAGLSVDEARSFIEQRVLLEPESSVVIHLFPPFMTNLPILPIRIAIRVNNGS